MKLFITKVVLYFLLLSAITVSCYELAEYIVKKKANFKVKEDTRYLVLGHSHPECAYNDSLIAHLQNLAHSGESYFYLYPKVKELIAQNSQVKTVFIELTNNQIAKGVNSWIWSDKYMSYCYSIYAPFIQVEDAALLLDKNPNDFIMTLPATFKTQAKKIATKDFDFVHQYGGFLPKTTTLIEYKKKIKDKKSFGAEEIVVAGDGISKIHLLYLHKIIEYLNKHGVRVFLIRTPQHPEYTCYSSPETFKKLEAQFQEVVAKQKGATFLDFSGFPLSDEEFRDFEHLNVKGANKLSLWLNKLIENKILQQCQENHTYNYFQLNNLLNESLQLP